jgi:rod shape-determining protein MreD
MLLVVVSWSLLRGPREGLMWGFLGGLALDFLSGGPFGLYALSLMLAGLLSSVGQINVFRSNLLLPIVGVFFATLLYSICFLLLLSLTGWPVPWSEHFLNVVAPLMLVNTILAPAIYQPMRLLSRLTAPAGIPW